MLSRILLLSLMLGICVPSFGMEQPVQNKVEPIKLCSTEEVYSYGEKFSQAAHESDYKLVFELAFPQPIMAGTVTHSDHEFYLYNRISALCLAYNELANRSNLNPKIAIKHYISIVNEVNEYLKNYGNFESSIKSFNERMLWHRFIIYYQGGNAYYKIGTLKNTSSYTMEQKVVPYKNAMVAYENALKYGNEFLALPHSQEVSAGIRDLLPRTEFNLLSTYCTLAPNSSDKETPLLMKKARQIYNAGQSRWPKALVKDAASTLEITKKAIEGDQVLSTPHGTKRVEAMRTRNYYKLQNELLESAYMINSQESAQLHLSTNIEQKNRILGALCSSQSNSYAQAAGKIREGLIDIETTVATHLKLNCSSNLSKEQLATIYEHLPILLSAEEVMATFWKYIPAFICSNDIEGGIHRADLLKELEIKEKGAPSFLIRLLSAGMRNLQGDHEEWLIFEAELEAKSQKLKQQKQQKKQAEKEKKEQQRLEALRLSMAQQQQKKQAEVTVSKQARPSVQKEQKLVASEPDSTIFEDTSISTKQSKLEKQKRHEEAELRRQQKATLPETKQEQKQPKSDTKTQKISKEMQLEVILSSSDKTLSELYELSSLPLKIDQEIELGTWQFTRDQFQIYLEAMGCICKSGHGVHNKASLPKVMHVMQGDNLITILNDFGGALTLPLWDKDEVPFYLRTQILQARKKLLALKIKALNLTVNEKMIV